MLARLSSSLCIPLLALLVWSTATIITAQTPTAALNYFEHGSKRYRKGDLDGAIADFTRAIDISSNLNNDKRRHDDSLDVAMRSDNDHVTVIDPFTARAYTSRALARVGKGDLNGAMSDLNRSIRIHPGLPESYVDRGAVRYAQGDAEGALADWNRAIQIDPQLAPAYVNRGAVRTKRGELDAAFADLNLAIALNQHDARAYCHRGSQPKGEWDWNMAPERTWRLCNPGRIRRPGH